MKIDATTIALWMIWFIVSSLLVFVVYGAVSGAMMLSDDRDACIKAGGHPLNTRGGFVCLRKDALIDLESK